MAEDHPGSEPGSNPFVVHRQHLDVYQHALDRGLDDGGYVRLVTEANDRVESVDGTGFVTTPLVTLDVEGLVDRPVLAKVETAAVGGSHKARHLFGLLLRLLIDESTAGPASATSPDLAIASCGNAALGAAVVARSAERRLRVFVPVDADPDVLERLDALDAAITVCHRTETGAAGAGDPCITALDEAVGAGAVAFTVQGTRCPDVIDGARTLGLELGDQLAERSVEALDLHVQIGGGALATAVMDGLARHSAGAPLPRLHPVQAQTAHPYVAGWNRIAPRLFDHFGVADPGTDRERASILAPLVARTDVLAILGSLRDLMTPWPGTPHSVAGGILDDMTYDWMTLMAHQLSTGGWPILVDEEGFVDAARLAARQVSPPPDATGAAGLAGLIQHHVDDIDRVDGVDPTGEGRDGLVSVVLLTGVDRAQV